MFRRQLIERAGFYPTDTILMEDNVLWGRALKAGLRFANIPEFLLKFRINSNFYKRRSGINYGYNYIKVRAKTNRELNLPGFYLLFTYAVGCTKMLPPYLIRCIYSALK
jgi:hypothetical protein